MKKKQPLSLKQIDMLINGCMKSRDRALIAWLYATGARVSEIVRVFKPSDLQVFESHVEAKISTLKNRVNAFRVLCLPKEDKYVKVSLAYLSSLSPDKPAWNMSRQYVHRLIKVLGYRLLGLENLHPHILRHSRLTHLVIYANFNEFELMRWAGWSDVTPARHYVRLYAKDSLPKLMAAVKTMHQNF